MNSLQEQVPIRIARIFNTFGPRMHMIDRRVVFNFILHFLHGEPITVRERERDEKLASDLRQRHADALVPVR